MNFHQESDVIKVGEPPTKGQPPKRGQKLCSQSVLYSEVPVYIQQSLHSSELECIHGILTPRASLYIARHARLIPGTPVILRACS